VVPQHVTCSLLRVMRRRYGEGVTSAMVCGCESNTLCAVITDARGSSCIRSVLLLLLLLLLLMQGNIPC
jgi:hypothetical protein